MLREPHVWADTFTVDDRLVAALRVQLEARRTAFAGGAQRVGWKLGMGDAERMGDHPPVGHLTSASVLEPGAGYAPRDAVDLRADAEVMVELGGEVDPGSGPDEVWGAISGFAAALEIVDLGIPQAPDRIVAGNIFHRAVAFGATRRDADLEGHGAIVIDGETRARAPLPDDLATRIRRAAIVVATVGERLQPGDRVITGSVVQVPIAPGDHVVADLGRLGSVSLTIAART